jgi:hypothetical protein
MLEVLLKLVVAEAEATLCSNTAVSTCMATMQTCGNDRQCPQSDPCVQMVRYARCLQNLGCPSDMYSAYFDQCNVGLVFMVSMSSPPVKAKVRSL